MMRCLFAERGHSDEPSLPPGRDRPLRRGSLCADLPRRRLVLVVLIAGSGRRIQFLDRRLVFEFQNIEAAVA